MLLLCLDIPSLHAAQEWKTTPVAENAADLAAQNVRSKIARMDERRLRLFNTHTRETLDVIYWRDGIYLREGLDAINHLMRDFRTGEVFSLDRRLIDQLFELSLRLDMSTSQRFEIVSAFRSARTQAMLASGSDTQGNVTYHMAGRAIDFRVSGVPIRRVYEAAMAMNAGGVGYYPGENFIHLDRGVIRSWRNTPYNAGENPKDIPFQIKSVTAELPGQRDVGASKAPTERSRQKPPDIPPQRQALLEPNARMRSSPPVPNPKSDIGLKPARSGAEDGFALRPAVQAPDQPEKQKKIIGQPSRNERSALSLSPLQMAALRAGAKTTGAGRFVRSSAFKSEPVAPPPLWIVLLQEGDPASSFDVRKKEIFVTPRERWAHLEEFWSVESALPPSGQLKSGQFGSLTQSASGDGLPLRLKSTAR
jgi:uncharacterized protein YcbK (DUF882 family)